MEQIRKTKIARHSVDERGRIYTCIETIVYDAYEIKNQNDIDFVVDKLKQGFYWWAINHWLELQKLLDKKNKKSLKNV